MCNQGDICEKHPLSSKRHFVAAVAMEGTGASADAMVFETMYASLGVGILPTVLHGDCVIDVQTMMLRIAKQNRIS